MYGKREKPVSTKKGCLFPGHPTLKQKQRLVVTFSFNDLIVHPEQQ